MKIRNRNIVIFTNIIAALLMLNFACPMKCTALNNNTASISNSLSCKDAINKGINWLVDEQKEDGSWSSDMGITAMCALAFLNAGYDESNATVSSAIQYILQYVQPDGSITSGTNDVYYTSVAVLALLATNNPNYNIIISRSVNFLISAQATEEDGIERDNWWYGGIGYGGDGRPDLSNTQFALMAIYSAKEKLGLSIPNELWSKALVFVYRCQNLPEVNDLPWAHNTSSSSYNDGGFIYDSKPESLAGGLESLSYGSMTAAGLWCLRLSGVALENITVKRALNWLKVQYENTWPENPNFGAKALYYYYWTAARALTLSHVSRIERDSYMHDWFAELSARLIGMQKGIGQWVNSKDAFWESIPELTTAYALLTLETRILPQDSSVVIELTSDSDLHVYDENGRHIGKDGNGNIEIEIPNTVVDFKGTAKKIELNQLDTSNLHMCIAGSKNKDYNLKMTGYVDSKQRFEKELSGKAECDSLGMNIAVGAIDAPITIYVIDELEATPRMDMEQNIYLITSPYSNPTYTLNIRDESGCGVSDVFLSVGELSDDLGNVYSFKQSFSDNNFNLPSNSTVNIKMNLTLPSAEKHVYTGYLYIQTAESGVRRVPITISTKDYPLEANGWQVLLPYILLISALMVIVIAVATLVAIKKRKKLK